jgi:drug/metabolite transporter (DMT)-like permease
MPLLGVAGTPSTEAEAEDRAWVIGVVLCLVAAACYAAGVVGQKLALRYASAVQVTTFGCFTGTAAGLPLAAQLLAQLSAPYNPRGHNLRRSRPSRAGTSVLAE